jgi:pimeloyl-ACP methyl ester carboxylesterase
MYASRHPENLVGVVLIDPALLLEWAEPTPQRRAMLMRGVQLSRRGAWLAYIGIVRLSLSLLTRGARTLPKLLARISSGRGAGVAQRLVGEVQKLPPEVWPSIKAHWCRPASFLSMADHLAVLPAVAAEVHGSSCTVPTIVISGGHLSPEQLAEHRALGDRHIVAEGSGHWVHLDRPDVVVAAVRELILHAHR